MMNRDITFVVGFASLLLCGLALLSLQPGVRLASPVVAQEQAWPDLALEDIGLSLDSPVHLTNASDGSGRLFVVERPGRIRIVQDGVLLETPLLDIHERVESGKGECGMLSVAFPPNFPAADHIYVYYNSNTNRIGDDAGCDTVVARYPLLSPNVADADGEEVVLQVDQPFNNHNGGQLVFGPDGYLYIGLGDGGDSNDPLNSGQRLDTLLGKLLRIDVETSGVATYTIPTSNPFTQTVGARPEIWAWGLRNPWRFSFDRTTDDLYIGDVGQNAYEEIDFQPAASTGGENYGWKIMEGLHCRPPTTGCDTSGLTLPIVEYDHSVGRSVTGGIVYRGDRYPRMVGVYVYADFITGRIWGLRNSGAEWQNQELLDTGFSIASFGTDEAGTLYAVDIGGTVYKLTDSVVATSTPTATATTTPVTPTPTSTPTSTPPGTIPASTPTAVSGGNAGNVLHLPLIVR